MLNACITAESAAPSVSPLAAEGPIDSRGCIDAIAAKPEYELLRYKLYFGAGSEYRTSYLRNKERPDEAEIEQLKAIHAEVQGCRKMALAEMPHAKERQALVGSHAADDKIWADMLAARLTWGKFNESRRIIIIQQQARLNSPNAESKTGRPPAGKLDLNVIDDPGNTLSDDANPSRKERQRGDGLLRRSSFCDRMLNSSYCSTHY